MDTIKGTGVYFYAYVGRILRECTVSLAAGQPIIHTRMSTSPVRGITLDSTVWTRRAILQAHTESGQKSNTLSFVPGEAMQLRLSAADFMDDGRNHSRTLRALLAEKAGVQL